ncbi:MAG: hypothetical protein KME04_13950 [Pleurocapsa minor GSE-CHR-MK-17-07R]|nr:hypothetical protein [Pleurocapsa minor GSE-CHR-MK 17-07R]
MALGVAFWLGGLLIIRIAGPGVFSAESPVLIVMYIASYPLLYGSLLIASAVSRVPMRQMLEPVAIMTFTAITIDGIVLSWLPQAYGESTTHALHGAAWLLFAAAAGLLIAWVLSRRPAAA